MAAVFFWLLVWGGMFSAPGPLRLFSLRLNPFDIIQTFRPYFPLLAAYLLLIWILANRASFPFRVNPMRFLIFYCGLGIVVSLFLSPDMTTSLYWASMYLSPFMVIWFILDGRDPDRLLKLLVHVNYGVFIIITIFLIPAAFRARGPSSGRLELWELPFGIGNMVANGVGRFALVSIIIASIRFIITKNRFRILWLPILPPALYLLARTQSRTALLGLGVACMLLVLLLHVDWRLVFAGPVVAYVVWISGVQWRAHGRLDTLVDLTGREFTWERAFEMIKQSPFLGWGFHADRLLLNSEHMHNSYLHAMIHSGLFGTLLFVAAFVALWIAIVKADIFGRARYVTGQDRPLLIESVLFFGFMTSRSFFESTGAFYGVDLLLLVPSMAYIYHWIVKNPRTARAA